MESVFLLAASLTSFLITFAVIPSIVQVSNKMNLLHEPDKRESTGTTFGGIALFIGTMLSSVLYLRNHLFVEWQYLYAAMTLLLFPALTNDIGKRTRWKKTGIELMAALILVLGARIRIIHLHGLFSMAVFPDWLSIPVSTAFILFMISAVGVTDEIAGLAGSVCLLISFLLGTGFAFSGNTAYAVLCLTLSGSLLALLYFNVFSGINRINLGNSGSAILGVILSAAAISFNETGGTSPLYLPMPPVLLTALFIIPVTMIVNTATDRILKTQIPLSSCQTSVFRSLVETGLSPARITGLSLGYTILIMGITFLFEILKLKITVAFILLLSLGFLSTRATWRITSFLVKRKALKNKRTERIKMIKLYPRQKLMHLPQKPNPHAAGKQTLFLN